VKKTCPCLKKFAQKNEKNGPHGHFFAFDGYIRKTWEIQEFAKFFRSFEAYLIDQSTTIDFWHMNSIGKTSHGGAGKMYKKPRGKSLLKTRLNTFHYFPRFFAPDSPRKLHLIPQEKST
jgi:hypothetical protein